MSDLVQPNDRTAYFTFQGQPVQITKAGMQLFRSVFEQIGGYESLTPAQTLAAAQAQAVISRVRAPQIPAVSAGSNVTIDRDLGGITISSAYNAPSSTDNVLAMRIFGR